MSQDNVEIVRRGFEAWEADDLAGILALFDEALITRRLAPMPDPGTWYGTEGMLEMVAEWIDTFDEFTMDSEEFIDAGDHVVVRVRQAGRGADSGAPVTGTFWFVFGISDGKVVSMDIYGTRHEALKAAGLSE
jgi:ketosteroid isomerase-like protein